MKTWITFLTFEGLPIHEQGENILISSYESICMLCNIVACENVSFCPRSSPLGTFRAEERLRLSDRNSVLITQINVYLTSNS